MIRRGAPSARNARFGIAWPIRTRTEIPIQPPALARRAIGGKPVSKGRYVAQLLPTRAGWTLILQAETSGAAFVAAEPYDTTKPATKIDLTTRVLTAPLESFSIWFIPSTAPGAQRGELRMAWDTVVLSTEWVVK